MEYGLALGSFFVEVEQLLCLLQLAGVFEFFTLAYASQGLCRELVPDGCAIFVVSIFDSQGNDLVNQHVEFHSAIKTHIYNFRFLLRVSASFLASLRKTQWDGSLRKPPVVRMD